MSTTSMAIFSNPLFATYSVYARNASFGECPQYTHGAELVEHVASIQHECSLQLINKAAT